MKRATALLALQLVSIDLLAQTGSLKKIYVGTMGQSDEAERFRLLLSDEIEKAGFVGVDRLESADAVLTGVVSVRVYADYSQALATVQLKSADGTRLWGKDFPPHHWPLGRDTVKLLAEDVARGLRRDLRMTSKRQYKN